MRTWPKSAVWVSALAIGIFQVVGSYGAAHNQTDRKGMDAFALVLVLLGPAALAVRDRWPIAVAAVAIGSSVIYIGSGYPYGPIFVSVVVALFCAVQAGPRRQALLVAVVGYGGYLVAAALDPMGDADTGVLKLALVAGWLAVVIAVAEVVRVRRDQVAERARAQLEEEERQVGEQRLTLARELHDVLAHNISLINVQASVALHLLDTQLDQAGGVAEQVRAAEQARPALANIKEASREALHELRTALDVLRRGEEAPRAPQPRLADVEALVDGVRASGLVVRLEQDRPADPLPAATELAAYRIVQEALTNVTRHARAHTVVVRVRLPADDGVTVEVIDDGVGAPGAEPGNGISGMRERAVALGGSVEAGPRPGGGFRVFAHLPDRRP